MAGKISETRQCRRYQGIAKAMMPIVGDSLADHQALAKGTGAEKWMSLATIYMSIMTAPIMKKTVLAGKFGAI